MINMAESKWSKRKEKNLKSKINSWQPRRKLSEVEGTFQVTLLKSMIILPKKQ